MGIHEHIGYEVESRVRFTGLLQSLAAEHEQLRSFTQDVLRRLHANEVGLSRFLEEASHVENDNLLTKKIETVHAGDAFSIDEPILVASSHLQSQFPTLPDALLLSKTQAKSRHCVGDAIPFAIGAHIGENGAQSLSDSGEGEDSPLISEIGSPRGQVSQNEHSSKTLAKSCVSQRTHEISFTRDSTLDHVHPSVLHRLQARVGVMSWNSAISYVTVLRAARSLGLEKYTASDMKRLLSRMAAALDSGAEMEMDEAPLRRALTKLGRTASSIFSSTDNLEDNMGEDVCIPFKSFAEFIVSDIARSRLGLECEGICKTLKEVLLSGDANRLVAELTCVRVDDLAAPHPHLDWDTLLEPVVGVVILLNGVAIGVQTDSTWGDWDGWVWVEASFTLFFLLEMVLRIIFVGARPYFFGSDRAWALLDIVIVGMGLLDFSMYMFHHESGVGTLTILRTCRMLRITRLFRIFRLSFMRELNIMVKGLLAGMRTLAWAILLLFFTIYLIAVLATDTLGKDARDESIVQEELFTTVPRSVLTCFRCFVGDCTTSDGGAIVPRLANSHGLPFVVGYLCSFIVVTLGLFNLIMALYVEITMEAAKRTEDNDKKRQQREAMRIARTTKKLLKKFCVAQLCADPRKSQKADLARFLKDSEDMDLDSDMTISKDLFLLIVQDQEVQSLMNELDIPQDRANLFEVLDADGTGDLHVTELVHGLLKVRGEARKSDIIANLLAVRAVQGMLRLTEKKVLSNQRKMMYKLGVGRKPKDASRLDLSSRKASDPMSPHSHQAPRSAQNTSSQ